MSWAFSPFIFNNNLIIWTTDALEFAVIIVLLKTDRVRFSKSVHFTGGTNCDFFFFGNLIPLPLKQQTLVQHIQWTWPKDKYLTLVETLWTDN